MTQPPHIVLAIESAIAGGSLSLLVGGREAGGWTGSASVSKAEEMLVNIDALLTSNGFTARDIDLIAVSAGPGSFTGIRIGLATALGLKAGLGVEMSSESALVAMASLHGSDLANLMAAVPVGRNAICKQSFEKGVPVDEPQTVSEDAFMELVHREKEMTFVLHSSLIEKVRAGASIVDAGTNIAYPIGIACSRSIGVVTEPLFIAKGF